MQLYSKKNPNIPNITNYQGMQITTKMRYQLTHVRMSIIKKANKSRCWRACGALGTLAHCPWKCKLV